MQRDMTGDQLLAMAECAAAAQRADDELYDATSDLLACGDATRELPSGRVWYEHISMELGGSSDYENAMGQLLAAALAGDDVSMVAVRLRELVRPVMEPVASELLAHEILEEA